MSLYDLENALDLITFVSNEDLYDLDEDYQDELREKLKIAVKKLSGFATDLEV